MEMREKIEDWKKVKIDKILLNRTEKSNPNETDKMHKYIGLEHINQNIGTINNIGASSDTTSMKTNFHKNDILFGKLRPYLRKYWFAKFDGVCSTEILALYPKKKDNPKFCFYMIQDDRLQNQITAKTFGTKMPRTSWNELKNYEIYLPPLPEQKKIATILSSVDEHIDEVDGMIEDLKKLKKGLMQKLLTEGIGHTEFKDSVVGRIPVEWEMVSLGDIFKLSSGSFLSAKNMIEGPYSVCGGNGVSGYHNKYLFEERKIIIGRVGAKCGCIHYSLPKSWITDNALYISEQYRSMDSNFIINLLMWLNLNMYANKNAQPVISAKKIYDIIIGFPSLEEQIKISNIIESVEKQISLYIDKYIDLKLLKKALMQQLLAGKTRVKI